MKKFILPISFLLFSLAGSAGVPVRLWTGIGEGLGREAFSATVYRRVASQMQEAFLTPIVPTSLELLRVEAFHVSPALNQRIDAAYLGAIDQTNALTRSLGTQIWYNLHDEMREVCPVEIREGLAQIAKTKAAIHQADLFLKPGDIPLQRAKEKVRYASLYYEMCATGVVPQLEETPVDVYQEADKIFNKKVFFLADPVLPEPQNALRSLWERVTKPKKLPLPKTLKVAIVADYGIGKYVEDMANLENLDGWRLDTFKTPEDFLADPNHLQYDLVLTDILISGGGGIYLTRQLRDQKFAGGILAVTAYPEEREIGVKLQVAGMDGMIALTDIDPYFLLHRPEILAQKMRNYFYYKNNPSAAEFAGGNRPEGEKTK